MCEKASFTRTMLQNEGNGSLMGGGKSEPSFPSLMQACRGLFSAGVSLGANQPAGILLQQELLGNQCTCSRDLIWEPIRACVGCFSLAVLMNP